MAVGAGVTSLLFFATLKKIHAIRIEDDKDVKQGKGKEDGNEQTKAPEGI